MFRIFFAFLATAAVAGVVEACVQSSSASLGPQIEAPSSSRRIIFRASDNLVRTSIEGIATRFQLIGPGVGRATITGDTVDLVIFNSDHTTKLIAASAGSQIKLASVRAGQLAAFHAKMFQITGNLNFNRGVKLISIGDVTGPARIFVGNPPTAKLEATIIFRDATDLSIRSNPVVKILKGNSLRNTDDLTDRINVLAVKRFDISEQMEATVRERDWFAKLPDFVSDRIYWKADNEEGDLSDWEMGIGPDTGGGVFNTGGAAVSARAVSTQAHSGTYSIRTRITGAIGKKRAVRLMRWTDRPWFDDGDHFPSPAYFSTWMYIPHAYDPGPGGYWNVFQFKSHDANNVSQPMWSLNLELSPEDGKLYPYFWASQLSKDFSPDIAKPVPVGKWVHIEAYYRSSTTNHGRIVLYQDGEKTLDLKNVQTVMPGLDEVPVWGLGNYTDNIRGGPADGRATIYFDDSMVGGYPTYWLVQ